MSFKWGKNNVSLLQSCNKSSDNSLYETKEDKKTLIDINYGDKKTH